MKWKIGNVTINNRVCLAPMAGINNSAFRTIVKEFECGLIYSEMVSDKAVMYKNKKTLDMLYIDDVERPITIQIFGSDKNSFAIAAKYINDNIKPDIIDINMGCPVPKIAIKSQAGAALLKDVEKIYEIVSSVVGVVSCPVTVKIRSGWDFDNINAIEVAKICEKAGASAICVHPRTRSQGYTGKADWNIIKQVKESVSIPVIGNGDVKNVLDAKRMLDETKCDAIMIGRAALGNPWLIRQIVVYLETGVLIQEPTPKEKIDMCIEHLKRLVKLKGENLALLEIRNHVAWYTKGIPNSAIFKKCIYEAKSINNLMNLINIYMNNHGNGIK